MGLHVGIVSIVISILLADTEVLPDLVCHLGAIVIGVSDGELQVVIGIHHVADVGR